MLEQRDGTAQHIRMRQVLFGYSKDGTGILTCFPFGVLELRYVLGPTNPRLTNIAEET